MINVEKGLLTQLSHQSVEETLLCFLHLLEHFAAVSAVQLAFHWERSSQHLHRVWTVLRICGGMHSHAVYSMLGLGCRIVESMPVGQATLNLVQSVTLNLVRNASLNLFDKNQSFLCYFL